MPKDDVTDGPITQDEMIALFGESMPIAAVNLLWNAPPEMTLREIRRELRTIAALATERGEAGR